MEMRRRCEVGGLRRIMLANIIILFGGERLSAVRVNSARGSYTTALCQRALVFGDMYCCAS